MLKIFHVIGLSLLLLNAGAKAQSGYNYARPEIANVADGVGGSGGLSAANTNALRPLIPLTSNAITTPTNGGVGYPTAAATGSGYGGGTGGAAPTPFGAFGTQPSALAVNGPTGYNAVTAGGATAFNAPKRPILTTQQQQQQRGGGGVNLQYGGGGGGVGLAGVQSAYGNAATRLAGRNDLDYSGEGDYSAIPGTPAIDYPVYAQVPQTNFDCAQQLPGYYSDVEAQCQVFHICALNRTYSFLCPNGTIFSQETLVCVWWNQFECGTAPALYANNAYIYDYGSNEQRPTLPNAYSSGSSSSTAQLNARQQPNYSGAIAGNTGGLRGSGVSPTLPTNVGGGIFGAANLRPTAFGALSSTVTPVPSTAGGYSANALSNAGRFPAAASPSTLQSFSNNAIAAISPTQANYGSGGGGVVGLSASPSPSTANKNREYLPPSQQQQRRP